MKFNTSKHISCIIIARGGSKGIPRKNLLPVCGKPLIYWTIQHALTSSKISDIWVSSDDNEILDYALSLGLIQLKASKHFWRQFNIRICLVACCPIFTFSEFTS